MHFELVEFTEYSSFDCCIFNIRIDENIAPKTGSLMSIVDLHNSELLHELMIYFEFLLSEERNYLLSQINGNDINEDAKIL
jgi:hypothetical protein